MRRLFLFHYTILIRLDFPTLAQTRLKFKLGPPRTSSRPPTQCQLAVKRFGAGVIRHKI